MYLKINIGVSIFMWDASILFCFIWIIVLWLFHTSIGFLRCSLFVLKCAFTKPRVTLASSQISNIFYSDLSLYARY